MSRDLKIAAVAAVLFVGSVGGALLYKGIWPSSLNLEQLSQFGQVPSPTPPLAPMPGMSPMIGLVDSSDDPKIDEPADQSLSKVSFQQPGAPSSVGGFQVPSQTLEKVVTPPLPPAVDNAGDRQEVMDRNILPASAKEQPKPADKANELGPIIPASLPPAPAKKPAKPADKPEGAKPADEGKSAAPEKAGDKPSAVDPPVFSMPPLPKAGSEKPAPAEPPVPVAPSLAPTKSQPADQAPESKQSENKPPAENESVEKEPTDSKPAPKESEPQKSDETSEKLGPMAPSLAPSKISSTPGKVDTVDEEPAPPVMTSDALAPAKEKNSPPDQPSEAAKPTAPVLPAMSDPLPRPPAKAADVDSSPAKEPMLPESKPEQPAEPQAEKEPAKEPSSPPPIEVETSIVQPTIKPSNERPAEPLAGPPMPAKPEVEVEQEPKAAPPESLPPASPPPAPIKTPPAVPVDTPPEPSVSIQTQPSVTQQSEPTAPPERTIPAAASKEIGRPASLGVPMPSAETIAEIPAPPGREAIAATPVLGAKLRAPNPTAEDDAEREPGMPERRLNEDGLEEESSTAGEVIASATPVTPNMPTRTAPAVTAGQPTATAPAEPAYTVVPIKKPSERYAPVERRDADDPGFVRVNQPPEGYYKQDEPQVQVNSYAVKSYVVLEGDTFDRVAKVLYGTTQLGPALLYFNRSQVSRDEPLTAGGRIRYTDARVLEKHFSRLSEKEADEFRRYSRATPDVPFAAAKPTPIQQVASPATVERNTVYSSPTPIGASQPIATTRSSDGSPRYTVSESEPLYAIARKTLGDGNRWREIAELNAEVVPPGAYIAPAGSVLTLPADAKTP